MATQTIDFNDVTSVTFNNQNVYEVYLNNTKMWNATPIGYYISKVYNRVEYFLNLDSAGNILTTTTPNTVWHVEDYNVYDIDSGRSLYVYPSGSTSTLISIDPQQYATNVRYSATRGVLFAAPSSVFYYITINRINNVPTFSGTRVSSGTYIPYVLTFTPVYA